VYFIRKPVVNLPGRNLLSIYQTVKKPIPSKDEKSIPIVGLYIYPIRGIRSPVLQEEIHLSEFGVKYDRELVLVDATTLIHVSTNNDIKIAVLK